MPPNPILIIKAPILNPKFLKPAQTRTRIPTTRVRLPAAVGDAKCEDRLHRVPLIQRSNVRAITIIRVPFKVHFKGYSKGMLIWYCKTRAFISGLGCREITATQVSWLWYVIAGVRSNIQSFLITAQRMPRESPCFEAVSGVY